ncbi:hypothetical protein HFP15_41135 [Amycolatopsis sp. K13G38]|uniref:DUF4111 domain-containing protein n=1 Tax=Amycolatopsis acididurans TaxID=2724524 RepID=A0ABX1JJ56_9PSEU|nr:hypothetical protein [Amycolatopsis acididurans]NKQ59261.1 hypothetical protein [Amycolatopsis acididurans]
MTPERILLTTVEVAREVFADRLSAAYALGSLAHGGFAPLVSDLDIALILDELTSGTEAEIQRVRQQAVARAAGPLAERLSIFWTDWDGVRRGRGRTGRLPEIDRLDLLDQGRLLHGADGRDGATPPEHAKLVSDAAEFACTWFDDARIALLHEPRRLVAAGPRPVTKAALFPMRFRYTLATGRIGHNADAAGWYAAHGAYPELAEAAMRWREHGLDDTADDVLQRCLTGVHEEFFDAYDQALTAAGQHTLAARLRERARLIG